MFISTLNLNFCVADNSMTAVIPLILQAPKKKTIKVISTEANTPEFYSHFRLDITVRENQKFQGLTEITMLDGTEILEVETEGKTPYVGWEIDKAHDKNFNTTAYMTSEDLKGLNTLPNRKFSVLTKVNNISNAKTPKFKLRFYNTADLPDHVVIMVSYDGENFVQLEPDRDNSNFEDSYFSFPNE